jgi:plasmid maintenance system killer protein
VDACTIVSFRDAWLRDFFVEDIRAKKIPADFEARLFRKLQMLMTPPPMPIFVCRRAIISRS